MADTTLKTYRARSIGEALAEVKRDLGKDAVILHTRAFRVGGWLGLGARPMVEVTASVGVNVLGPQERRARAGARPQADAIAQAYGAAARPRAGIPEATTAAPVSVAAPAVHRDGDAVRPAGVGARVTTDVPLRASGASLVAAAVPASTLTDALGAELSAIKRLVGQVLQCSRHTALRVGPAADGSGGALSPAGTMPDPLFQAYLRLLESEVAAEIADEVVGRVRDELSPSELADGQVVRAAVIRRLAALVPADTDTPAPEAVRGDRPLTIALIGPTGVGKTTTVAKLAAAYKLRHGRKVALVTCDTYRIAAVDQLRTYAEIIGLPLKVVLSPEEMAPACAALGDADVILIDTAGRSPRDSGRLSELRRFIGAARPHQTHLVLSGTAGQASLVEAAERFGVAAPDRVIFTKLDEAVNFGVLFNVARRLSLRLSYVTTGQEVPDHIEQGRSDRLARLVLDGASAR